MELGLGSGLGLLGWSLEINWWLGILSFFWIIGWTMFLNVPDMYSRKSK
jgi:hypothetical protein